MRPTEPSSQFQTAHDPVAAIAALQRSQQRFWRGFPFAVLAAAVLAPVWAFTLASSPLMSKVRLVGAMVSAALVALPLRFIGRVSELKLALPAGGLAVLSVGLGDVLARATGHAPPSSWRDGWFVYFVTYCGVAWVGTSVARNELKVEASQSGSSAAGAALPPPQAWADPNAVVFEEVASVYRKWGAAPGTLRLTTRSLQFFDKGAEQPKPFIRLSQVQVADRSALPNALLITMADGTNHRFVVVNRDKWIVHINSRIQAAGQHEAQR